MSAAPVKKEKPSLAAQMAKDFAAGGISGTVAKTITAPIERVKLIIQTQDANPKIRSGEVPRYTGIVNCFTRVASEQGLGGLTLKLIDSLLERKLDQLHPLLPYSSPELGLQGYF